MGVTGTVLYTAWLPGMVKNNIQNHNKDAYVA